MDRSAARASELPNESRQDGTIRYAMETVAFFDAIQRAWCRSTSADPEGWNEALPALGQCAVTALVVQDGLGGDLLRSVICGVSHYWNRLDGGGEIDLTRGQFPHDAEFIQEPETRSRDYVLSFPATRERYEILRKRMGL